MRGEDLTWWEQSAQNVRCFCTVRTNESQKLAQAYRNRDKEDKEASKLGHSCLKKARELGNIHLFQKHSMIYKELFAEDPKYIVIDYTPGPLTLAKTALELGAKLILAPEQREARRVRERASHLLGRRLAEKGDIVNGSFQSE